MNENSRVWDEDSSCCPVYRMAHVAFPFGRYIVILNGYSNDNEDERLVTLEFDYSSVTFYDVLEGQHQVTNCVIDENSCRDYGVDSSSLAASGSAITWHDSSVFIFAGFSILHGRSTNYLLHINFKRDPLEVKMISGGSGSVDEPVPSCRDKCSINYWEQQLLVFGGYGYIPGRAQDAGDNEITAHYLNTNGVFILNNDDTDSRSWNNQLLLFHLNTRKWSNPKCFGAIPTPRAAHATCIIDDTMYVFGGRSHSNIGINRLNDLHALHLPTMEWTAINLTGNLPCGRSWLTLNAISSDCLLIVGGIDTQQQPLSDAHVITLHADTAAGSVNRVYPNASRKAGGPRLWHTSTMAFDGCVYAIGGCRLNLFNQGAQVQQQIDRYCVMRPLSLLKQSLRVAAKLKLCDSMLPTTLLSKLQTLNGG